MGVLPYVEALLLRFVLFFDKVPALALLPILFIVFGLEETSKIVLIVIGVVLALLGWRFFDMQRLLQRPRIEVH